MQKTLSLAVTLFPFGALAAEPEPSETPWFKGLATPQLAMVFLLLIVLGLLFYFVFRWSQRNEQASYLGQVFRESVFDFELNRRARRLEEKLNRGEYLREAETKDDQLKTQSISEYPQPDPQLRPYLQSRGTMTGGLGRSGSGIGTAPPGLGGRNSFPVNDADERYFLNVEAEKLPEALKPLWAEYNEKIADRRRKREEWFRRREEVANRTYQDELSQAAKKADAAAKRAADVDIAVFRGRGPTFVLEFTAVVVIIFAAMILRDLR